MGGSGRGTAPNTTGCLKRDRKGGIRRCATKLIRVPTATRAGHNRHPSIGFGHGGITAFRHRADAPPDLPLTRKANPSPDMKVGPHSRQPTWSSAFASVPRGCQA